MRILSCFLVFSLLTVACSAQLKVIEKTLTDLHVTSNSVTGMVRQQDGRIVILGTVAEGQVYRTALIRFDSTGLLDASFGKGGIDTFTTQNFFPNYQVAYFTSIALQGDKVILAGGTVDNTSGFTIGDLIMMRFTANGKPDSSFGYNAVSVTDVGSATGISIDEARQIALDSLGNIIVAGKTYDYTKYRFLVARYTANGLPDVSFNLIGYSVFDIGTEDDEAMDIAAYPNRRIIVMGKTYVNNSDFEVSLLMLNNDGTPYKEFGSNGVAISHISALPDIATRMLLVAGGKIVCTGNSGNSLLAVKYNASGTLDSTFGNSGIATRPMPGKSQANAAVLQTDRSIIIGGYAVKGTANHFFAAKLLSNGKPDSAFAEKGIFYKAVFNNDDEGRAIAVLPTGNILQAGVVTRNAGTLICVLQFNAAGLLNTSFGNKGIVTLGIGSSTDRAFKMKVLPWDNTLLLSGTANGYWSLVKYGAGKSLHADKNFGINGVTTVPLIIDNDQFAEPDVAIDTAWQKIYMCGLINYTFYLLRFNKDGSADSSFGKNGVLSFDNVSLYNGGLAVLPNHKVVFAAARQDAGTGYNFAAMLNSDGSPDTGFGTAGEVRQLPLSVNSILVSNYNNTIRLAGYVPLENFSGGVGVLSLTEKGGYDANYGKNGLASVNIDNGAAQVYFKYSLAQDNYGRMLVSGSVQLYTDYNYYFSVSRFSKNGLPDAHFGKGGVVTTYTGSSLQNNPANEGIDAFCTDSSQCNIATAGTQTDGYFLTARSIIAAYTSCGALDTLQPSSIYLNENFFGGQYESGSSILFDSASKTGYIMYLAGSGGKGSNLDFSLVKLQKGTITRPGPPLTPNNNFYLYPNPAHNQVKLSWLSTAPGRTVYQELIDLNGKILQVQPFKTDASGQLNTTITLPAGLARAMYFVKIIDGTTVSVKKLMVL